MIKIIIKLNNQFLIYFIKIEIYKIEMIAKFLQTTFSFNSENQNQTQPINNTELLPADLAGKILDLQMQCEGNRVTKQLITELITLYTSAVEHFEAEGNAKFKIYQKRMHLFLSRPSIEDIMNGKTGLLAIRKEMAEKSLVMAEQNSREQASRLIQKTQKRAQSNKKKIQKQIKVQQQNLQSRIQRRRTMSNKSMKSDNDDFGQSDGREMMSMKLILNGIKDRNTKRVFI